MIHYSCDQCGQPLDDRRFVVRMEIGPAFDPSKITEEEIDEDHLQAVSEMIQDFENSGIDELEDCHSKSLQFDLCPRCHARFLKDPLGREASRRLNFSKN